MGLDSFEKFMDGFTDFKKRTFIRCSHCLTKYTFDDFRDLMSYWVDPKNKKMYGKGTVCKCGMRFHEDKWHILTKVDNVLISTADLEIAHAGNDGQDWFDYNFYYETMFIFTDEKVDSPLGKMDKFGELQYRYKTQEEAVRGHEFVVKNINKMILHPEQFPQSIIGMFANAMGAANASRKVLSEDEKKKAT